MRVLAFCGLLAPIVLTASWIVAGLLQPTYSARREDLSALAARTADHAWVMIAGLVLTGLLTSAFALGLYRALAAVAGPALVGLAGAAVVALGLLRNDCSTLTSACEARIDAGAVSWQHRAHDAISVPVFVLAAIAPLLLALRFRSAPGWGALAPWSAATAATLALLFAVGGFEAIPGWDGVVQRAGVTLAVCWLGAVAMRLLRLERRRVEPSI